MRVVGVDENGLGPRLGPLVATAVSVEIAPDRWAAAQRAAAQVGIRDSKAAGGFKRMQHCESIALALLERTRGELPTSADDLLHMLSLDGLDALKTPCPLRSAPQCWSSSLALPAFEGEVAEGRRALQRLERAGARARHARSAVACARVLGRRVRARGSKLAVDLEMFERLLVDAREHAGVDIEACCGMVGGIRKYPSYLSVLADREIEVLDEVAHCCRYGIAGLGRVRFEVDADASHFVVSLASIIGKYVREVAMARQNRFYRDRQPELPEASGYHDPITRRFVEASRPLRRHLGIDDACFER